MTKRETSKTWEKIRAQYSDDYFDTRSVCKMVGLSDSALANRIRLGMFPEPDEEKGPGHMWLWRKDTVLAAIKQHERRMEGLVSMQGFANICGLSLSRFYVLSHEGRLPKRDCTILNRPYWLRTRAKAFAQARNRVLKQACSNGGKVQTYCNLARDQHDAIKAIADSLGISISYAVSLAVVDWLNKQHS